jgi:SPP1 family predicted phage head-tail adaptor
MRAGQLRHVVTIEEPIETQDAYGGVVQTWEFFLRPFAALEAISSREFFGSERVEADVDHRLRIRYHAGITPKMRVLHGARVFEIKGAPRDLDGRRRELELLLRETV